MGVEERCVLVLQSIKQQVSGFNRVLQGSITAAAAAGRRLLCVALVVCARSVVVQQLDCEAPLVVMRSQESWLMVCSMEHALCTQSKHRWCY
jgi:hypothetical protein